MYRQVVFFSSQVKIIDVIEKDFLGNREKMRNFFSKDHGQRVFVLACLGHFFVHFCLAFYFVIVLSLETVWSLPYHQLIGLWTLGSLMVGVFAVPAGAVADRFGAPVTISVFFTGLGLSTILAGYSDSTYSLLIYLTAIGIFSAIYHPAAIPWLVRNSKYRKGKSLAINGIFGSFGGAGAAGVSGFLIEAIGWRAAFLVPGICITLVGIVMFWMLFTGVTLDSAKDSSNDVSNKDSSHPMVKIYAILMISMLVSGLIYNGTQISLPKLFELRQVGLFGDGISGIGTLVAGIYIIAGTMQLVGGHLADNYSLKSVYVGMLALQIPFLWLASISDGVYLIAAVVLMVVANTSALPAENMLLSRFAPAKRQGFAFGLKFLISFAAAPVAVQLVAIIQNRTGEFSTLFVINALLGVIALVGVSCLPRMQAEKAYI